MGTTTVTTVASVEYGTGNPVVFMPPPQEQQEQQQRVVQPQPQAQLQPLSEDDFAKATAAVRARDELKPPGVSPAGDDAPLDSAANFGASTSPAASIGASPGDGNRAGGAGAVSSKHSGSSDAGIDQRLFAPVLRAILAGEGDHVLRRSLLCHPFLKATKTGSSASAASPSLKDIGTPGEAGKAAPSPLGSGAGSGRRKGSKGSKGGKAKKRERDRDKDQEDWGTCAGGGGGVDGPLQVGPALSRAEKRPLDASREVSRLAELAASDESLQSTLILVKTLLCAVDPGAAVMDESPRHFVSSGRTGRSNQASGGAGTAYAHGSGNDSRKGSSAGGPAAGSSTGLTVRTAPLRALAGRSLSGWEQVTELLRREKYRERMSALRGRPSLTVCCGKADIRGRLEAKGEACGVVTAVHVRVVK